MPGEMLMHYFIHMLLYFCPSGVWSTVRPITAPLQHHCGLRDRKSQHTGTVFRRLHVDKV